MSVTVENDELETADRPAPHGLTTLWLVLDRSASMAPTAEVMRNELNAYLAGQASAGQKGRLFILGFGDDEGLTVLGDALDLRLTSSVREAWLEPAGTTALLDALDLTLDLVERRMHEREGIGHRAEDHLVVLVSDGADNTSRGAVSVERRRNRLIDLGARGVTVVAMAGTVDARDRLRDAGLPTANVAHYLADRRGVAAVWEWLDVTTSIWRGRSRKERRRRWNRFLDLTEFERRVPR